MLKANHPWRTRSREFQTHLANLPPAAREKIKAAESAYLERRSDIAGRDYSALRAFSESMVGASAARDPYDF